MNSENQTLLDELVNKMMKESNHNPRDYCFRYVVTNYPKAVHDAFDFPGEYMDNLKVEVFTEDGRNLEMDCAQLVMPKGDITCKSTINVEHQTYPLLDEKIGSIYDYKLYLIHQTNIPSNSIVMTNKDIGEEIIFCKSHDQFFKVDVNIVTEEKISKKLKILEYKISNNKSLSLEELMYFTYIAIFVNETFAKEDMEKIASLFPKINQIESKIELDIHQILKKMIKYHFKEDEIKCRELLTMISESIFQRNLDGLTYKERTEIQLMEKDKKLEQKNQQLDEKNQQLDEKNQQLDEKDQLLGEKEEENERLKKELNELKQRLDKG